MHAAPHTPADVDPDDSPPASATFSERPSKTRLKQASHELQDLGEAVVALPDDRLAGLAISETLLDAFHQFRKTRTHEGRVGRGGVG